MSSQAGKFFVFAVSILFIVSLLVIYYDSSNSPSDTKANEATAALYLVRNSLPVPETRQVTQLIIEGRFEEFEDLSSEYEEAFVTNPHYESPLVKLYDAIDFENTNIIKQLKKWVLERPSHMSYSALGSYYTNRGYYLRGEDWYKQTSN